jgi:proteasome regulatory subunit
MWHDARTGVRMEDAAEPEPVEEPIPSIVADRIQTLEARNAQLLEELRRAESERRFVESELIRLQKEIKRLRVELDRLKTPPLIVGSIKDILEDGRVVVRSTTGPDFIVYAADFIEKKELKVGSRVALNKQSLSVISVLPASKDTLVANAEVIERPTVTYADIGGLQEQIEELKETVEYPLTRPEDFRAVGIEPPKGILLIGPPGTGKTLLAKAVAERTKATFIHIVGSELVQKYIGEGSRIVRELFDMAREKAPSIVFIDEIDSIGAKRLEIATSGDREVQRTLMQLLAELDGFDPIGEVKVIAATNRVDILDDALLRPGRFDRVIEIPMPTKEARESIFRIHTKRMNLSGAIDFDSLANRTTDSTGADIKAICMEAGMFAIRAGRRQVTNEDFDMAIAKILVGDEDVESHTGAMFA